ncbi:MAG: hypothetical protein ACE5EQ_04175 [Phycisphaerae bacterium]
MTHRLEIGAKAPTACGGRIGLWIGLLFTTVLAGLTGCASQAITADVSYYPPPPASAHAVHLKSFNRLRELVSIQPDFWERLRGQSAGPSVSKPAGIAYRSSHLYICDTDANAVLDWDLTTGGSRWIGDAGDTILSKPVAIAVSASGGIYVADTGRAEVVAFDPSGRTRFRIHPPGRQDYRPVAVALADSIVYVADIAAHRVDLFSTADGRYMGGFGEIGAEPGRIYFPMGLCVDAAGRLLLSDMMNGRVQVFETDPEHARPNDQSDISARSIMTFGRPGNRYGEMGKPRGLDVGPDGVIFIADPEYAHIHLYDGDGRLLMMLGGPDEGPGQTTMPVDVAVARSLPKSITRLVPDDFQAAYYLFVTNTVGIRRINLFAIGTSRRAVGV